MFTVLRLLIIHRYSVYVNTYNPHHNPMKNLKFREGHTSSGRESKETNPDPPGSKPVSLPTVQPRSTMIEGTNYPNFTNEQTEVIPT